MTGSKGASRSTSTSNSLLRHAHVVPLVALGLYAVVVGALLTPYFQNQFVFLHSVNYPFYANFSNPERYGIAPSKARNVRIATRDGLSLGAWHLVPDAYYTARHPRITSPPLREADFDAALKQYPTVLYFHGNAGNRAAPFRTASYAYITSRLHANVVAIDYRGFGDSKAPGVVPSEEGLVRDARAAWDWVVERQGSAIPGANTILMGQSLGTGVVSRLALEVTEQGTPPQAAVLIAPYASLRSLVLDYRLGGVIPVMGPLRRVPGIDTLIDTFLITQFNSTAALHQLYFGERSSVGAGMDDTGNGEEALRKEGRRVVPHLVLVHATSDDVIPYRHSEHLYETLTTAEHAGRSSKRSSPSNAAHEKEKEEDEVLEVDGFGRVLHLDLHGTRTPASVGGTKGGDGASRNGHWESSSGHADKESFSATINLIRTHWGGHNTGFSEGVADFVRQLVGWSHAGLSDAPSISTED